MTTEFPRISHDEEGDIIYIEFSEAEVVRTREAGSVWVNVDEAADGSVVAIEFVNAHAGIDLRHLPRRDEVELLLREFNVPVVV